MGGPSRVSPDDVDRVLAHFVAVMSPRRTTFDEQERKIVRDALKVASADECCRAIDGCAASDYHMKRGEHAGRTGAKYNTLSQILKSKQGKYTTRERIDFFLDFAERAEAGPSHSAADRARIVSAKQAVLDALEFPGDELVVKKGGEAASWLASQGWQMEPDPETGRPTFRLTTRE